MNVAAGLGQALHFAYSTPAVNFLYCTLKVCEGRPYWASRLPQLEGYKYMKKEG